MDSRFRKLLSDRHGGVTARLLAFVVTAAVVIGFAAAANLGVAAESLSAAESRIRDVDIAQETSRMTSYQILQQAGVSILSQANMTTGLAMSLLQ